MGVAPPASSPASRLHRVATVLLLLVVVGMAGLLTDLLLLGHYEDAWQLPPVVLLGVGLVVAIWTRLSPTRPALRTLGAVMALCIVTGGAGLVLHYQGNSEFQREMDPEIAGWPLFVKVMRAAAPPALAPAALAQLGLLGLLYVYAERQRLPATAGYDQETGRPRSSGERSTS